MEAVINGAHIHYEREGSGLPVIFLHAGIADSRMWKPQVAPFAQHFDVVRPDTRGFGKSPLPPAPWSPVEDLLALIDELSLKPTHLVGCSMGGSTTIDFALDHPERVSKLVLVGSGISGFSARKEHEHLFAAAETAVKAGDLAKLNEEEMYLWLDGPTRPRGYVKQPLRDLFLDMNNLALQSDFEKWPPRSAEPPALERLSEITAPVLVVVGDGDMPTTLEAADLLMQSLPHARKAVIHDAAHLPNLELPEEFNRLVLDFLLES
jgi:pimeloyl-ACP methyl ester carboxylesterase